MTEWLIKVELGGEVHLYPLGEADEPGAIDGIDDQLAAARAAHGLPDDWFERPESAENGWDVSVISGPPHPTLLARATMHEPSEA